MPPVRGEILVAHVVLGHSVRGKVAVQVAASDVATLRRFVPLVSSFPRLIVPLKVFVGCPADLCSKTLL